MIIWEHEKQAMQIRMLMHQISLVEKIADAAVKRAEMAEKFIKDHTDVSADVHRPGGPDGNCVIVTGYYRGGDYVQTYKLPDNDFKTLIDHLKVVSRYATVRRVDCMPSMRGFFAREVEERPARPRKFPEF